MIGHHAVGDRPAPRLSVILPVLDEAGSIRATLASLAPLRAAGHQVIVADGGSSDTTTTLCQGLVDHLVAAPRGRAQQMNAGAALALGDVLLFLHADTQLPPQADQLVACALQAGAGWGRFDVCISGQSRLLPLVAALMNLRSRLTGIATGDQAIFVRRALFHRVGGFADQPLMEDIALCRQLRRSGRPACLRAKVITSGRRWDSRGAWRTIRLMWWLRWRYWRGAAPEQLARAYR